METNKFFKFLWRANAIFIFGAAMGAIIIVLLMGVLLLSEVFHEDTAPPPAIEAVDGTSNKDETFRIRLPYNLKTVENFTYFELRSGEDSYGKVLSGSTSQNRNIGVYDTNTKTTHWVFESSNQEIESFLDLPMRVRDDAGKVKNITKAFLLKVANSNVDGTISRNLWIMPLNGKNPKNILSGISGNLKLHTTHDDQLTLMIETEDEIDIYPIDLETLTLGAVTTLSMP